MLAYHCARSDNTDKAYHYLRLSGEKATRNYATREAFHFFHEAFDLLKKTPDAENEENKRQQIEILYAMTGPLRTLGYPEDSLQLLEKGKRLSQELEDRRSLIFFSSDLGVYHSLRGYPSLGVEYSRRCFQEAEKMHDTGLMARVGWDLCISYSISGQSLQARDLAQAKSRRPRQP